MLEDYRPQTTDTEAFVQLRGQMLERIIKVLGSLTENTEKIERWRSDADLMAKRFEAPRTTDPELYRQGVEFRQLVDKQTAQVKQIKDLIAQTQSYVRSAGEATATRLAEAKKWKELDDTPLGELTPFVPGNPSNKP